MEKKWGEHHTQVVSRGLDVKNYYFSIFFGVHETKDNIPSNAIAATSNQDYFFTPIPGKDGGVVEDFVIENAIDPPGNANVGEVLETVESSSMVNGNRLALLGVM